MNTKLYNLLDRSAELVNDIDRGKSKMSEHEYEMFTLLQDNISFVKQRSMLKKEIDQRIDEAIKTGKNDVLLEVKKYG